MPKRNDRPANVTHAEPGLASGIAHADAHATIPVSISRRVLAGSVTSAAIAAYAFVISTGIFRCPVASLAHVPCPTCGATRSSLALLDGDLHGALVNPFAPVMLALLGGFAARLVFVAVRDGHTRRFGEGRLVEIMLRVLMVTLGLAIVVWIARFFGALGGPVPV
jgi:hypothetical protein